ncbi:Rid family hydrolase [Sphingomonas sp. RIT328]|uniref:Rid family hydrolase n=1 Tax=Sphingomonas sp. RIT328 TaxID=1470591 RepID=UPI00044E39FC|nr:Rid family hydrolase [Sphingomonas sp. RIT328]EZP52355.1 Endoribonuclease L-PSP precursor [Sphingomonas sp. RIT328]
MTLKTLILGAALAAALLPRPGTAQTVGKHASTPAGLILQSVTVKPGATTLYLSGQLAAPLDPARKIPPAQLTMADLGDTKTQTLSVLAKIKTILAEHGFAMSDIIKLTVFVAGDPKLGGKMDFAGMNDGFKTYFGTTDNPTTVARSTVQVAALAGPAFLVEIEAIAAK